MTGESVIVWTIRLSFACFVASLTWWMVAKKSRYRWPGLIVWSLGCGLFWWHTVSAYQFAHDWSHQDAVDHVRQRSEQLVGLPIGFGIYFNWLFGLVWTVDCGLVLLGRLRDATNFLGPVRWWLGGFMVFMWINGAIIFAQGAIRWLATGCLIGLSVLALIQVHRSRSLVQTE